MASPTFWRRGATVAIAAVMALAPLTASGAPDRDDLRVPRKAVSKEARTATWLNANKWFVEFESEPTATGGKLTNIRRQQSNFKAAAKAAGHPAEVNKTYERLFNGVSVNADVTTAETYAELPGVKSVYPVRLVSVPETSKDAEPRLLTAIAQTGADIAQNELGLTGAGVKVGVIDTGIDIDHPAFGGSGTKKTTTFPTTRVAYGWDFVGDDYNADPTSPNYQPVPKPDNNPDDCQGHGTHVAGIVGANGGDVVGVAPDVTFGAYRVFGCGGSVDTQIILDALERAEADGMDVVNMSLGSDYANSPEDPTAKAADRLVRNGVVVVNSAGNAGDMSTMTLGSPGSSDLSINVASFDNSHVMLDEVVFTAESGPISTGFLHATGSPETVDTMNGKEVVATTDPLGCVAETADLSGKIALVQRGTCTFHEKAFFAQQAGADGVVIYNNQPGYINATVEGANPITVPVVTIVQETGDAVAAALPATVDFTGETTVMPNPSGGLVSDFSSWGLASDLTLQPDVGAPGGSIRSAYPLEKGGVVTMSGTSMAAPHTAGAVALMLEANPALTAKEVRDRLQNSAEPAVIRELPDFGFLDAAHRQGAGLIQVDKAVTQDFVVSPGKISAGEGADGPHTETLTITNTSDADVTWSLGYEDALSTYLEFDPDYGDGTQNTSGYNIYEADVTFSAETVTVPAGGSATVDVTIAEPEVVEETGVTYTGYVSLTSDEGATTVTVPFAGLAGDYGDLEIFPEVYGLPSMVEVTKCETWVDGQCWDSEFDYELADAGHIFEGGTDLPAVAFIQNQPVLKLTIDVLKADAAGNPVEASRKTVLSFDHLGRSGWEALFVWDGQLADETGLSVEAAPGDYVIQVTGVEADGDGGSQSWTSNVFGWKNAPVTPTPTPTVTVPVPGPTVKVPVPGPTVTVKPAPEIPADVYNTPGLHEVNGRKWFTACEPYSQTVRCRTMIWGTQVTQVNGAFKQTTGWVFNNLTYLPHMTRGEWGTNPLANNGSWTAADGRKWRTECDTAATGRGGCRSYITASVIASTPKAGGGYTYQWVTKEILNNIVRFKQN